MAAGYLNANPAALPGVGTELDAAVRQLLARDPFPNERMYFGSATISGASTRDPDNPTTNRVDVIRDGMPMGRLTGTNKWAPSLIGTTGYAVANTDTTLWMLTAAEVTELVRRVGATGTFIVTGPPTAAGTVRSLTATYTATGAGTGKDCVQAITWNSAPTAGTFTITFLKANGAYATTTAIAYGATIATVQAAIDVALGVANGCVVTGTTYAYQTMALTFSGTGYTRLAQPLVVVDDTLITAWTSTTGEVVSMTTTGIPAAGTVTISALGVNEVQTVSFPYLMSAGTFTVAILTAAGVWKKTPSLAYSDSAATLNGYLDTMTGVSSGIVATNTVASTLAGGFVLTYSGTGYAGLPQTLAVVDLTGTALVSGATGEIVSVTRTTTGVDGRFTVGSWIQVADGSQTPLTLFKSGNKTGVSDFNALLQNIDVIYPEVLIGGDVRTAYIIGYSTADASLKTWLKTQLRSVGGSWRFDDDYGYSD